MALEGFTIWLSASCEHSPPHLQPMLFQSPLNIGDVFTPKYRKKRAEPNPFVSHARPNARDTVFAVSRSYVLVTSTTCTLSLCVHGINVTSWSTRLRFQPQAGNSRTSQYDILRYQWMMLGLPRERSVTKSEISPTKYHPTHAHHTNQPMNNSPTMLPSVGRELHGLPAGRRPLEQGVQHSLLRCSSIARNSHLLRRNIRIHLRHTWQGTNESCHSIHMRVCRKFNCAANGILVNKGKV